MNDTGDLPSTFHNMKYGDLQKWAKRFGIRANLKAQKLVEALMKYVADNKLLADDCQNISDASSFSDSPSRNCGSQESNGNKNQPCDKLGSRVAMPNSVEDLRENVSSERKPKDMKSDVFEKFDNNDVADSIQTLNDGIVETTVSREWRSKKQRDKKIVLNNKRNTNSVLMDCVDVTCDNKSAAAVKKTRIPHLSQLSQTQGSTIKPFSAQYWAKLHQRQFDQMDSLDVYMNKKTERALSLLTPNRPRGTALKEVKAEIQKNEVIGNATDHHSFIPTIFSTAKMNINFSEIQMTSLDTRLKNKTMVKAVPTPSVKHSTHGFARKSLGSPFVITSSGNSHSGLRPKFDIQASLARPITWKPYIGKLKETYARNLRYDVKKVQMKSRDDRRKEINEARSRGRVEKQCIQRGIAGNQ